MEVLKPEVYWIGNRCYRINPLNKAYGESSWVPESVSSEDNTGTTQEDTPGKSAKRLAPYVEVDDFEDGNIGGDDGSRDEETADIEVLKEDGGFKVICGIPSSLYPQIIGSKGAVKKRIEMETQTRIFVPRPNERGDVVVRGQTERNVRMSHKRLEKIASAARFKRDATHFVCFPIATDASVVEKAKEFQEKVLSECGVSRGLDQQIFLDPHKLHLTICVLILLDERERRRAAEILSNLKNDIKQINEKGSLKIHLKDLDVMNDDPSQTDVLYAKCASLDGTNTIQKIADLIAKKFAEQGLGKETRGEKVKLHCTIINTRYRNKDTSQTSDLRQENHGRGRNADSYKQSFDSRAIFQKFGDFEFGTVELKEVKIATRHTKASDGFYKCYSSLSI